MYVPVFTKGSGSGVGGDLLAFNSLFEIRRSTATARSAGRGAFNSLFEIQQESKFPDDFWGEIVFQFSF